MKRWKRMLFCLLAAAMAVGPLGAHAAGRDRLVTLAAGTAAEDAAPDDGGDWEAHLPDAESGVHPVLTDIARSAWYYGDVDWAWASGLMTGVAEDRFAPEILTTRAMIVTVLARLDGANLSAYDDLELSDMPEGIWYARPVKWAMAHGILSEAEEFQPSGAVTRGEMARMLAAYLREKLPELAGPETPAAFADAPLMTEAEYDAFQLLYQEGVFQGVGETFMDVHGSTTRAQLAALMHRLAALTA